MSRKHLLETLHNRGFKAFLIVLVFIGLILYTIYDSSKTNQAIIDARIEANYAICTQANQIQEIIITKDKIIISMLDQVASNTRNAKIKADLISSRDDLIRSNRSIEMTDCERERQAFEEIGG